MDVIQSDEFSVKVEDLLAKWHIPGLSVAVFDKQKTSAAGFGFATLDPPIRATSDTIYDIASTSKSLTAAAVGKLVSDNKTCPHVHWDTAMSTLLPGEFVLPDPCASQNTTIEDILSHRTGMPGHDLAFFNVISAMPDTPQSVTMSLRNFPMTASFRTKYQYCNMMYTVATYLVEKLSEKSFAQFLQENFFNVLGTRSSHLQPSVVFAAGHGDRLATRYMWDKETESYRALNPVEQPEAQGAGSIQSTVNDYSKWVRAMMRKDESLLPREVYEELIKPRIIADPEATGDSLEPFTSHELYAFGWSIRFYRGRQIVEHSGGISGFESHMLYMPQLDFGLVICGNCNSAYNVAMILAMQLIDRILDVPVAERVDWVARFEQKARDVERENDNIDVLRRDICPSGGQPLQIALESFTGTYENIGYRKIVIDVQDGKLHVDGTDRSEPFTMFFEHVCEDRKFVATLIDDGGAPMYNIKSEFRISTLGDVTAVGIAFCEEMGDSLVWFDRIQ